MSDYPASFYSGQKPQRFIFRTISKHFPEEVDLDTIETFKQNLLKNSNDNVKINTSKPFKLSSYREECECCPCCGCSCVHETKLCLEWEVEVRNPDYLTQLALWEKFVEEWHVKYGFKKESK